MRPQILGIDYGQRKMGVAMADLSVHVVTPLGIFTGLPSHFIDQISELVRLHHVVRIVVGMPYRFNGQLGAMAEEIQKFVMALREKLPPIPVVLQDERLTTQAAKQQLRQAKVSSRKKADDALAAAQILQTYLDRLAAGTFV